MHAIESAYVLLNAVDSSLGAAHPMRRENFRTASAGMIVRDRPRRQPTERLVAHLSLNPSTTTRFVMGKA